MSYIFTMYMTNIRIFFNIKNKNKTEVKILVYIISIRDQFMFIGKSYYTILWLVQRNPLGYCCLDCYVWKKRNS